MGELSADTATNLSCHCKLSVQFLNNNYEGLAKERKMPNRFMDLEAIIL